MPTAQQVSTAISKYWGIVMSAATQHLNTADLWGAIRDAAEAAGLASPGVSASAISVVRGQAGRIAAATENLAAAQPELGLDASMIAQAPWSRPLADQNTTPLYQVRFESTVITPEGGTLTQWQTTMVQGSLPGTVGDLTDLVTQDAQLMAAAGGGPGTPRGNLAGIGSISVISV
jgi:hypothetical protein